MVPSPNPLHLFTCTAFDLRKSAVGGCSRCCPPLGHPCLYSELLASPRGLPRLFRLAMRQRACVALYSAAASALYRLLCHATSAPRLIQGPRSCRRMGVPIQGPKRGYLSNLTSLTDMSSWRTALRRSPVCDRPAPSLSRFLAAPNLETRKSFCREPYCGEGTTIPPRRSCADIWGLRQLFRTIGSS